MKKKQFSIFVFGFTCNFEETNNANVFVTKIEHYATFERRLTLMKTTFSSESETRRRGANLSRDGTNFRR